MFKTKNQCKTPQVLGKTHGTHIFINFFMTEIPITKKPVKSKIRPI